MTAGQIKREALLVVEKVTVKTNEDIELGEVIYDDGSGWLAAPNTTSTSKLGVAIEAHDYSALSEHSIRAVFMGCVSVQKMAGALRKGDLVMVGATAGEVTKYDDYSDQVWAGASGVWTNTLYGNLQTTIRNVTGILGTVEKAATSGATECDVWVGVK